MAKKNSEVAIVPKSVNTPRVYDLKIDVSKLVKRTSPRLTLPKEMPIGAGLAGVIVAIVPSPSAKVKGECLRLRLESGEETLFPLTGVIRKSLAEDPTEEVGKKIVLIRKEDIFNNTYQKPMYAFDVYTE
jgi:hypothetical protein